jgi:hypothetical protein
MNDKNGKFEDESEPVFQPSLIRCEATFHTAPGFEYLDSVQLGESESCEWAPLMKVEAQLKPVAGSVNRFSVEEYHRLIERGILTSDDQVELLEGFLVQRKYHYPPAACTLQLIGRVFNSTLPLEWCFRIRSAITLPDSEPAPDVAVVRADDKRYLARHPQAEDIGTLIEVADSTLLGDRSDKGRIYARAGVSIYWIVNLIDRHIEVYEQPSGPTAAPAYAKTTTYQASDSIPVILDGTSVASFPVQELLP